MSMSATRFAASVPSRPAGWYEDPVQPSARRWWNGEEWTAQTDDQFRPVAVQPPTSQVPPSQRAGMPVAAPARPWYRSRIASGIAVLLLGAAVAAAALGASGHLAALG